ncbi:MAG: hypothetical protein ABI432_06340 [Flavobacteriales bacterium]
MRSFRLIIPFLLSSPVLCAQVLPVPPQVWLNTCMPITANTITVCSSGCDYTNPQLQTAFNNALPGTTILLQSGHNYIGPYTLPMKTGDEWIIVRTNIADAQLPDEDHRIDPSYAPVLAKLQAPVNQSALVLASGAHHYRVMDLEVRTVGYSYDIIVAGSTETSVANVPHDLVFDRLYIHGDPLVGTKRGIRLNSASTAVINCWISDCKAEGQDAQAIAGWNGPGPFKIVNNHLEGSGENIMFGGALATITDLIPSDIEIRNNHFFKPPGWHIGDPNYEGTPWCIKNLFELKNAQRVWVEGNILENNWAHCQSGFALVFTPRTEGGAAMNNRVTDVTWKHNILINSEGGFNITPHDDQLANPVTSRILIEDNLAYDVNRVTGGGDGKMYQVLGAVHDLTIQHNTTINTGTGVISDAPAIVNGIFRDNITGYGPYGICGTGIGCGINVINTVWPGGDFSHNAFFGGTPAQGAIEANYPPFHWFPDLLDDVGFADVANHDYTLLPTSAFVNAGTDGTDLGVNMDSLNAHTNTVLPGYWPNCADLTTAVREVVAEGEFTLSPVPTRDVLTVTTSREHLYGQVRVLDANGRILRSQTLRDRIAQVFVGDLPAQPVIVVIDLPSGARRVIGRTVIL